MPSFNEEDYIEESVRSIMAQNYDDYELIVVDDGSTDDTKRILERLQYEFPLKLKCYFAKKEGKVSAFNLAYKYSTGNWLGFFGADDVMPPNALKAWDKIINRRNYKEKIAICGKIKIISEDKKYDGIVIPRRGGVFNWTGGCSLQSRGMSALTMPIPDFSPNEDSWCELFYKYYSDEIISINDIVLYYRIHSKNTINRYDDYLKFNDNYHARMILASKFYEKYNKKINMENRKLLRKEIILEQYRNNGKSLRILFLQKYRLTDKLRAFFFSRKRLYRIKIRFDRYMLGH